MAHRFLVKDIALQAGVGTATVDRVLNGRGGVRQQTADRVRHAISELEAQAGQLAASGVKLIIDLVVEAPQSFRDALDAALKSELPLMRPAAFRVRADTRTHFPEPDLERALDRAARLGSHGVIFMGPDTARVRSAVSRLIDGGVPVVTLATDLPDTPRTAYVGLDNARAGRTAAWLIHRWLGAARTPRVLITVRNDRFSGEEAREAAFRHAVARLMPSARLDSIVEGHDTIEFSRRIAEAASSVPVDALYSIGGNNRLLLRAIEAAGRPRPHFIAHDLDADNRSLLSEGLIDIVLYHDLAGDIRNACRAILSARSRGAMPAPPEGAALLLALPPMMG